MTPEEWLRHCQRLLDAEIARLYEERRHIEEVEAPRAQKQLIAILEDNLAQAQQTGNTAWEREIRADLKKARRLHLHVVNSPGDSTASLPGRG